MLHGASARLGYGKHTCTALPSSADPFKAQGRIRKLRRCMVGEARNRKCRRSRFSAKGSSPKRRRCETRPASAPGFQSIAGMHAGPDGEQPPTLQVNMEQQRPAKSCASFVPSPVSVWLGRYGEGRWGHRDRQSAASRTLPAECAAHRGVEGRERSRFFFWSVLASAAVFEASEADFEWIWAQVDSIFRRWDEICRLSHLSGAPLEKRTHPGGPQGGGSHKFCDPFWLSCRHFSVFCSGVVFRRPRERALGRLSTPKGAKVEHPGRSGHAIHSRLCRF